MILICQKQSYDFRAIRKKHNPTLTKLIYLTNTIFSTEQIKFSIIQPTFCIVTTQHPYRKLLVNKA